MRRRSSFIAALGAAVAAAPGTATATSGTPYNSTYPSYSYTYISNAWTYGSTYPTDTDEPTDTGTSAETGVQEGEKSSCDAGRGGAGVGLVAASAILLVGRRRRQGE